MAAPILTPTDLAAALGEVIKSIAEANAHVFAACYSGHSDADAILQKLEKLLAKQDIQNNVAVSRYLEHLLACLGTSEKA